MGLIKESKKVNLLVESEPWTEEELKELRKIMKAQKSKRKTVTVRATKGKAKQRV